MSNSGNDAQFHTAAWGELFEFHIGIEADLFEQAAGAFFVPSVVEHADESKVLFRGKGGIGLRYLRNIPRSAANPHLIHVRLQPENEDAAEVGTHESPKQFE